MSTYTIGEAARRSGFSASALRFYEDIGLVDPPGRTPSGYRLYDDAALARLAFIARAKQLGCSLEEITDLADVWDGQRCGPVQHHFHDLITAKFHDAETQVAELSGVLRPVAGGRRPAQRRTQSTARADRTAPACAATPTWGRSKRR